MNKLIIRIGYTIGYIIFTTLFFLLFKNKSNIPNRFIIPIIVALQAKYIFGDWDKGFVFTNMDIVYWISLLLVSYIVVISVIPILKKYNLKIY